MKSTLPMNNSKPSKPSFENSSGAKHWYDENKKYHREDGPAKIESNGTLSWWIHGELHREDGPAVIYADGNKYWYINDKEYNKLDPIFNKAREKYPERFI